MYIYIHIFIYLSNIHSHLQTTTTNHHPTKKAISTSPPNCEGFQLNSCFPDSTTVGSRPVISEICCTLCLARCNLLAISATSSATGRMLPCKIHSGVFFFCFCDFSRGSLKSQPVPCPPPKKKRNVAIAAARFSHPKRKRSSSNHSFSGSSC